MPYSPIVEFREPLVVATPEQLEAKRSKITKYAGMAILRAIENPDTQYAVFCRQRRLGLLSVRIEQMGRYYTDRDIEESDGWIPGLNFTPEDGVYYQKSWRGSPSGTVDIYAEKTYAALIEGGAEAFPASRLIRPETAVRQEQTL